MKFLEAFVACCVCLRVLIWPIIMVCLVVLAYCGISGFVVALAVGACYLAGFLVG